MAPTTTVNELSPTREVFLVCSICLAQLISLAGLAQTVAPLPIIGADFGEHNPAALSWLPAAFSLTAGTFILPAGRLGDMYGLKRMYIVGFVWYGVFSLIAGMSVYVNFTMLAVCRGLQGIGPAILVPNALALVGKSYRDESVQQRKHLVMGFFAASAPTGFLFGALFSSLFAQLAWWPWMFWSQAIVCWVGAVFAYLVVPTDAAAPPALVPAVVPGKVTEGLGISDQYRSSSPDSSDSGSDEKAKVDIEPKRMEFDSLGALTGVTGLILVNFAFNDAPRTSWSSPAVLSTLILGSSFLVGFVYIELRIASHPLLPPLNWKALLALACISAGWASFGIWMFYWWQLQEVLRGYLPLSAVAQNAAVIPSGLLASLTTGLLLSRVPVSMILLASMLCFVTGMTLLATVPLHQTFWGQTFVSLLTMPWGMDMSFPSTIAIVSQSLPAEHQGTASALVNVVVNYSISMGLGIAGTIIKHTGGTEDVSGAGQPGPHGQSGLFPGGDEKKTMTLLRGFRAAWDFGIGLDVLGVVIAAAFVASEVWRRRKARRLYDRGVKGGAGQLNCTVLRQYAPH